MISQFLYIVQTGWDRVRANGKLLFLVMILFIFPILFVLVLEQFYAVAQSNIQTIESERTGTLHDSVVAVLPLVDTTQLGDLLTTLSAQNTDVRSFRVYQSDTIDQLSIIASSEAQEINSTTTPTTLLQLGKITPNQTFSVPLLNNRGRFEQSVRYVVLNATEYYIFSEHSRVNVDTVLGKRKQDAYILLSLIFAFLIGLAYWVNRQADWEKQYVKLHGTLLERDLFSNMIAHEFRTPLTAIKGYASFLQDSTGITAEDKRYADTIRESAERLVLLVNDFLEIARIQSGKMKIETKQVDVRSMLGLVTKEMAADAKAKGLQLIYTPALKPQLLVTDENRCIQIITNIISNSVKYTDIGTVEISCEQDRSGVTIRVKDTGMGISAEDQKKIFAPFSRVGGVEKTSTAGTGLGMWITKQMVDMLNGNISVESIKGVGTHVVLHFSDVTTKD